MIYFVRHVKREDNLKTLFSSKNIVSTSGPLQLHLDLFDPTITVSISGKRYGLAIVDDYSRWTWVMFHHKDKSFDIFF